ncbi:glutamate-cysteine ligase family protein [Aestuariirhabdus litorea]|uniref:Glutamate--cysteine ligase n=1 Tax=Aestuariirhabdus litorea TaxID=2528527 RepID=A0A3P3VL27_9GAMM|nr:glutamate-cysteine ligase family protein [Aestuariirhabdus litorea]RRJ83441.1 hypothetical protein D0544_16635 [Aestuariirhabdus litorea]RWW93603.1 hypothetical protein DZC74_16605 [Endozoicomonadaceae bacterium GTF-13]
MGSEIDRTEFTGADFERFRRQLQDNLGQLRQLLCRPGFGEGAPSFGAELELYLIDAAALPLSLNQEIAERASDPALSLELNRFNLEYNFPPIHSSQAPFSQLRQQIDSALTQLGRHAAPLGARLLAIGILPTLRMSHMGESAITDSARYRVLSKSLKAQRGEAFNIDIRGADHLQMRWQEITLEGANTSFQYHYRVRPSAFADTYNAAQLITPLVLALGANSPLFLGHRLWHETRVALFKQSIDPRTPTPLHRRHPSRVSFGQHWVKQDITELFEEGVSLFPPLLPVADAPPSSAESEDRGPSLEALRLHQGSIWCWNRALYDPADGGHLRIELRALPAGPSSLDMVALAAFAVGLMEGLRPQMEAITRLLPFGCCKDNFYRAAREGLGAQLVWPNPARGTLRESALTPLVDSLLPCAAEGLSRIGIHPREIDQQLELIRNTLSTQTNGARWQLASFQHLSDTLKPSAALSALVESYYQRQQSGLPVHQWELADGH